MRADLGDRADHLVTQADAAARRGVVEQVEVGAADRGALYGDDGAVRAGQLGLGDLFDPHVAWSSEDGGAHAGTLPRWTKMAGSEPMSVSPLHPSTVDLPALADEDIDAFFEFEDLWAVIVWNDDVTTFQTVIQAFVEIFGHTVERADQLAWKIHRTGKAVAAVRPKDEAEAAVHALHLRKISATLARA